MLRHHPLGLSGLLIHHEVANPECVCHERAVSQGSTCGYQCFHGMHVCIGAKIGLCNQEVLVERVRENTKVLSPKVCEECIECAVQNLVSTRDPNVVSGRGGQKHKRGVVGTFCSITGVRCGDTHEAAVCWIKEVMGQRANASCGERGAVVESQLSRDREAEGHPS